MENPQARCIREDSTASVMISDVYKRQPLFRLGEILLNYAEAMYELGQFDQSIADETINKLRKRAHVADMVSVSYTHLLLNLFLTIKRHIQISYKISSKDTQEKYIICLLYTSRCV